KKNVGYIFIVWQILCLMREKTLKDIIIIGLALFAMFFGAGNLIFPPYLGEISGDKWVLGFFCYFIADVGLAILAIIALLRKRNASIEGLVERIPALPGMVLAITTELCMGPLLAIPRTAATTFEMAILPFMPNMNSWIFGAIFFSVTLLLVLNPTTVVDIIGKYLTPILVIFIFSLLIIGIISPIGEIGQGISYNVQKDGILLGYQTMDVIGAIVLITLIISTAKDKGYRDRKKMIRVVLKASFLAAALLFVIYGGLTYLGATTSLKGYESLNHSALITAITHELTSKYGLMILGVIVTFACLTTAVGIVSAGASFFERITGGKISYGIIVTIIIGMSYIISNIGLSKIIDFSEPILSVIYPMLLTLIFLTFFDKKIKNDNVIKGAVAGAFVTSIFVTLDARGLPFEFIDYLPLSSIGLGWIVPTILGGLIGRLL
ncbi:MAG: branched-chain amino acid transport system II carrier protein, partial [Anaerovoracaceae bacterium]